MYSKIISCGILGIDGYIVEIETDISNGLPAFDIVGLGDTAVREARERVRSAVKNSGYEFPLKKITLNMAPANIKKKAHPSILPSPWASWPRRAKSASLPSKTRCS